MGSKDVPPRDVAEVLTPLNLVHSRSSETCPACSDWKGAGQSLCVSCRATLPHALAMELQQRVRIEDGYDDAMLRALRFLRARVFFRPGARAIPVVQLRLDPEVLTVHVLRASLEGLLCPKCAGSKVPGRTMCNLCTLTLRRNLGEISSTRNISADLFRDERQHVDAALEPRLLETDPAAYALGIIAAIRWTKGKVFYHPQP